MPRAVRGVDAVRALDAPKASVRDYYHFTRSQGFSIAIWAAFVSHTYSVVLQQGQWARLAVAVR